MTRDRELKREVRARMRQTGERYTAALLAMRGGSGAARLRPHDPEGTSMNQPHPMVVNMFQRFTNRARTVVTKSENLARREGLDTVAPRHILLGVIAARGQGWDALGRRAGVEALEALATVEDSRYQDLPHVPYRPESKKVLEHALVAAITGGHDHLGTEHVLAGLLDSQDPEVQRMLAAHGADPVQLRNALPGSDPGARAATRAELTEQLERGRAASPPE